MIIITSPPERLSPRRGCRVPMGAINWTRTGAINLAPTERYVQPLIGPYKAQSEVLYFEGGNIVLLA